MVDQLERTTNLLALLLETRVPLTLDDIVNQLAGQYPPGQTALRGAFERDKGLLRDIGVPIETEVLRGTNAGQTGYRVDRDRYELRDLDLTEDERRALQVAVAAARTTEAEFGMFKLGGVADSSASITANLPQLELLPALREAIAARSTVSFSYHAAPRSLQPYALLLREGFWYVIGHDLGHDEVRTYRVDRIEGSIEQGQLNEFERPADFDPRAVFPADPKELGDGGQSATVRIDSARATFAVRELGEESVVRRLEDGAVEVEVPCSNLDAFRSWLFGWGAHAEVVAPAAVRAGLVEWLRAMASRS
ncbi:MAG: WYL domain-containing protein [Ilumatobacteraceae bacterium]|nr:WYL domain-containing protein [Ilumatobacteraceae bacterium]